MDEDRPSTFSITRIRPVTRSNVVAAIVAGALACACGTALAQRGSTMIAIDTMEAGDLPAEFDIWRTGQGGPAKWVVASDPTAGGGKVIEQISNDTTDYRFPLAIYKPISARNVDVTLRFKAVAGAIDRAGGIAVRLTDPDNYYVVRANALEDNVRFYRMVKGRREQIEGTNIKVTANEWHSLGLRAEGERFTITFNGQQLYTATDPTFADAGKVALWTKADSVTRFDRIEITTLP
jgi:hypothetical protein